MPVHQDEITLCKIESYVSLDSKTVLEIGCGDGRVTRYLTGPAELVVALDPDLSRLTRATGTAPTAQYVSAVGAELSFAEATFDLVFFTLSLHHHPDCAAALAEAARVLRPHGHVVVLEPVNEGELEQICNIFKDEGPVLADAQAAIDFSALRTVGTEIFTTTWHLDDAQTLVGWLFEFYDVPFAQELADEVLRLLGDKSGDAPLLLDDLTKITCLSMKS